jgi:hypothetical protein
MIDLIGGMAKMTTLHFFTSSLGPGPNKPVVVLSSKVTAEHSVGLAKLKSMDGPAAILPPTTGQPSVLNSGR